MSLAVALLFVVGGLALLAAGGELLVRGAITVSRRLRVAPAVIGLTIVAFATSLPELAVSLLAALRGSPDVAVGNVVGSNMFNVAAILGLSAMLFSPLYFRSPMLRLDVAVMIGAAVCTIFFARDLFVARWEGAVLLALLVAFLVYRIYNVRREAVGPEDLDVKIPSVSESRGTIGATALIFAGAGILTGGAEVLVRGAVALAEMAGVSERVIAITLVSAGTGLPELATSIVASVRKHAGVAVGNVIGSNIFNVFGILGTVALVSPIPVSREIFAGDMWWMLAFSLVVLVPVLVHRRRLSRIEGVVLFLAYVAYVVHLF